MRQYDFSAVEALRNVPRGRFDKLVCWMARTDIGLFRAFLRIVLHIELPCPPPVGLHFGHHFNIVVHADAHIGAGATLYQGVTIGENPLGGSRGVPTIGEGAIIYPNAVVVGPIRIGKHCVVGACSVVTKDIEDFGVVAGNPAVLIGTVSRSSMADI